MTIATYHPGFVEDADKVFTELWDNLDWIKHDDAPRREYWSNDFNSPYTYGQGAGVRTYNAQPFHDLVLMVREQLMDDCGIYFEACFLNGYEGERQSLGWHADDSPNIDHSRPIAVVSFGEKRPIQYRPIDRSSEPVTVDLEPGSLFMMNAGMQQTHQHRIPKASFKCRPRISMTFRSLFKPVIQERPLP